MNTLEAIIARVRELADGQEMNVSMANPWHGFIPNVPYTTLQVSCVSDESRDISKRGEIEVWSNHRSFNTRRLITHIEAMVIIKVLIVVVIVNVHININFISHHLVMVGVERCRKSYERW